MPIVFGLPLHTFLSGLVGSMLGSVASTLYFKRRLRRKPAQ